MTITKNRQEQPTIAILEAAAAVFAEHGYGGARVDEIARRAGVNKAMLYYHVGDKARLFAAVLAAAFTKIQAALAVAIAAADTPEARLRAVVRTVAGAVRELPHHPRIMLREVAAGGETLPDEALRQMTAVLTQVRGVLDEGQQAGAFRPVDPLLTHLMVLGSVTFMSASRPLRERVSRLGVAVDVADAPERLADFLSDVLLHGISAHPREGSR